VTSVAQALADGTALLRESSASCRADALLLLEHALGRKRGWIAAHGEAILSPEDASRFRSFCARRTAGMPAAYILRSVGFYGREFALDEGVLIPRPETEHLVDEAVAFARGRPCRVLDVGTGSGAIACSIAAETQAEVHATDVSAAAVRAASENARRLGVASRCFVHQGDLLEPVKDRRFDLVVANLPYIPTADLPRPPSPVSFEPRSALDGGADGLVLYRRLLAALPPLLEPGAMLLLEAAPPTMPALAAIVREALARFTVEVCYDYAGLERYVKAAGPPAAATADSADRARVKPR
jgi:release factor glutamine methyltransferase